ncbi:MAG: FAD-dependent oxidoreductase [Methylomonas sp.]|jgi:protoporphyrinogen oxidase
MEKDVCLNRRMFLKGIGLTPLLPSLSACQLLNKLESSDDDFLSRISPINRIPDNQHRPFFSGDDFSRPHRILWNKQAYLQSIGIQPKPNRKVELAIVGAGMSGLMSAYLLSDKKPLLLEQSPRFGGNAKAESWNGLHYAIGAAYLVKPGQDAPLFKILKQLDIVSDWTIQNGGHNDAVLNGKRLENFWTGASEPKRKADYKRLYDYFMSFNQEGGNVFPDYPTNDVNLRQYINVLDRENFRSHLETINGSPLPLHLATLIEHYCFSSFGGSATEISAAAGINFFAGEFKDLAVFPGGNAYIAEALLKHLHQALPANHLLPECLVYDVRDSSAGVVIGYVDANQQPQTILSEKVIMACPKFVAAKLIDNLSAAKLSAIAKLEYRAYLVANLLVNHPIDELNYDIFWLGSGQADFERVADYAKSRGITDIINANFSSPHRRQSVLSFYQAFPYHGGRAELFSQDAYAVMKTKMSALITKEVYPFYRLNERDVVDLRLSRWGHPLPLAEVGLLDRGIVDTLRAPIDDRIYFIEQDNWALPAIETVAAEADYWSAFIK